MYERENREEEEGKEYILKKKGEKNNFASSPSALYIYTQHTTQLIL